MTDIAKLLENPAFHGMTITQAVDYSIKQDPKTPTRFLTQRAKLGDDERLVREYAENPELKEGLWRMHKAGRVNCTCEAIAMHFPEFIDLRDIVKAKIGKLIGSDE